MRLDPYDYRDRRFDDGYEPDFGEEEIDENCDEDMNPKSRKWRMENDT